MSKADGQIIVIQFTEPILSGHEGNEHAFTITTQEYDGVPDGTLITHEKDIESIHMPSFHMEEYVNIPTLQKYVYTDIYISYSQLETYILNIVFPDVMDFIGSLQIISEYLCLQEGD